MKTFITSDLHFFHANIIELCKRPFSNVDSNALWWPRRMKDEGGSTMLEKLTENQEAAVVKARKHYFDLATCTEPADRAKAATAVRELAALAGVKIKTVLWVNCPQDGKARYDEAWDSLWNSLGPSLCNALGDSLGPSLCNALGDSLDASLSLWDIGWMAFCIMPRDLLGVVYAQDAARKLDLWIATLEACFAAWIVPGTAILCERPAAVEIVDGRLVGLTWRSS